jgi:hypothetical protein
MMFCLALSIESKSLVYVQSVATPTIAVIPTDEQPDVCPIVLIKLSPMLLALVRGNTGRSLVLEVLWEASV